MTTNENEVVMALSRKLAWLEKRFDRMVELHIATADRVEAMDVHLDFLQNDIEKAQKNNDPAR